MFAAQSIPYQETHAFSQIVSDYLDHAPALQPFYAEPPSLAGIQKIIQEKKKQPVNRDLLVRTLLEQYKGIQEKLPVQKNIGLLSNEKTFTVCTAHQPNLFTGPLYFIYKILHAIRLAAYLQDQLPEYHFVPVYYMGSEDADFAELNHTYIEGKKIEWKKEQKGAVGRMKVDGSLISLIEEMERQLYNQPYCKDLISLLRHCYSDGKTIQQATFELVNELYGRYGLVVLIPDEASLKKQMEPVFKEDLFQHSPASIVRDTSEKLSLHYGAQAHPRDINLFYLKDNIRERIERNGAQFSVLNTGLSFTEEEMVSELEAHPERFSPNVILRGLFQETILPNIAFIGGGGELAYWLQLKALFDQYKIVYPVLIVRNSFLIVEDKWQKKIRQLGIDLHKLFAGEEEIMREIVNRQSGGSISLNGNLEKASQLYTQIGELATAVDPSLTKHVAAIQARSLKLLAGLEKKMYRAEKRKFTDQQRQLQQIKSVLFPNNGLQERVENFSSFYAKWGLNFIDEIYQHSFALEQQFCILLHGPDGEKN